MSASHDRTAENTELLRAVSEGAPGAAEQLLPLVYDELHRIANQVMRGQDTAATLQPTALIHEAYLRLVDHGEVWNSRGHFVRVAARAMRNALVDQARARGAQKRGGAFARVSIDANLLTAGGGSEALLVVHESLTRLAAVDEQLARIVELRFYGGLENKEIAAALEISLSSVVRSWRVAKAWLLADMQESSNDDQ